VSALREIFEELSAHLTGPEKVIGAGAAACVAVAGAVFAGPALADAGSAVATFLSLDAKTIVSAGLGAGAVVAGAWKAIASRAEKTAARAASHAERTERSALRLEEDFGVGDPNTPPVRVQLAEIRNGVLGIAARHERLEAKVESQGAATLVAYGEVKAALAGLACDPFGTRPKDAKATAALRSSHAKRASGRTKRGKK
jgi:hypothetical protein